jgi:hypothetical protein
MVGGMMVDELDDGTPEESGGAPKVDALATDGMGMPSVAEQAEHKGRGSFDRALSQDFIEALTGEAKKPGWWADVLNDPTLLIALRGTYLNVYFRGMSLFNASLLPSKKGQSPKLRVTTHEKYLLDPALSSQIILDEGRFRVEKLMSVGFLQSYDGKSTLSKMKKACSYYAGPEKTGCHEIAIGNPSVVDCEIAFSQFISLDDGTTNERGRVDFACFEAFGEEDARLVFWEAKHFSNAELRADLKSEDAKPPVIAQMKKYQAYLAAYGAEVVDSYARMAKNWVAIADMGAKRSVSPLIREVGLGKRRLILGEEPKVRLVIFGFDAAQRNDKAWQEHLARLKKNLEHDVLPVGNAKAIALPGKALKSPANSAQAMAGKGSPGTATSEMEDVANDIISTCEGSEALGDAQSAARRNRLATLARFEPVFTAPGFVFADWTASTKDSSEVIQLGYSSWSQDTQDFVESAYKSGWISVFDWGDWLGTPEAKGFVETPSLIGSASEDQLRRLLTACVRSDRFNEGALKSNFDRGILTAIVRRAAVLLREEEPVSS